MTEEIWMISAFGWLFKRKPYSDFTEMNPVDGGGGDARESPPPTRLEVQKTWR